LLGNQMARASVVVIQLTDICLGKGKIFSSHINSFSVAVVRSLKVLQDCWGFVILYAKRGVYPQKKWTPFLREVQTLKTATVKNDFTTCSS
jgi:hypothetical protein